MPYCMRCRSHTNGLNGSVHKTLHNRIRIASHCKECGCNQSMFISNPTMKGKGIDFVNFLNNNPITRDVEFHLPLVDEHGEFRKASYLGPNTNLEKRISNLNELVSMDVNDISKDKVEFTNSSAKPVNKLDELAMIHDLKYTIADKENDKKKRLQIKHSADKIMSKKAWDIVGDKKQPITTRGEALLVSGVLKAKQKIGLGVKKR